MGCGFSGGSNSGKGRLGGGERTKARSQEQQCTQNGATCPLLALGSKGTLSWGTCPHFFRGVEESLPGPPVVEASSPPQISFPAPALLATWGPKFCLCPPTLCSISGTKWSAFRGFRLTTPGSPPMTEGVSFWGTVTVPPRLCQHPLGNVCTRPWWLGGRPHPE